MKDRRTVARRADGLTDDERLTILEAMIDGDCQRPGLLERMQKLEHKQRQRELGWFGRLLLRVGVKTEWYPESKHE